MADFYAVITTFPGGALPDDLADRSARVKAAIMTDVPALTGHWVTDWAFDDDAVQAIDIVFSDDRASVEQAAKIISEHGGCDARVAQARSWSHVLSGATFA